MPSDCIRFGDLDPILFQLITLYPHLLPVTSNFMRSVPPLHEIADIQQLARGDAARVRGFKDFLIAYLEEIRGSAVAVGCQQVGNNAQTSADYILASEFFF